MCNTSAVGGVNRGEVMIDRIGAFLSLMTFLGAAFLSLSVLV
jgi:hypothetical protein